MAGGRAVLASPRVPGYAAAVVSPDRLSSNLQGPLRRLRWEARTVAGEHPSLCRLLVRRSGVPVGPGTEIVIEGFPRTGNTFAVTAFLQAQGRHVEVAHHVHAPAQLIEALRLGIPALALVREPEEAVLSFVVRLPHLSVRQVLRSYIRFYRPLRPYRHRLVVADLREVSSDFGAVIDRVNARFGTDFVPFEQGEANVRRAMDAVDASDRSAFGSGEALERSRARPTPSREARKDRLRADYHAAGLERWRNRAERLYEEMTAGSPLVRR